MRRGFTLLSFGAVPYPTEEEKEKYLVEAVEEALRGPSEAERSWAKQVRFAQAIGIGPKRLQGLLSMGCSVGSTMDTVAIDSLRTHFLKAHPDLDRYCVSPSSARELRQRLRARVADLRSPKRSGWRWEGGAAPVDEQHEPVEDQDDPEKTRWSVTILELLEGGR